jgi:hypothetical protein
MDRVGGPQAVQAERIEDEQKGRGETAELELGLGKTIVP